MALHTYTPYEWKNAPDHKTTPLSADNLNHIEQGIKNAEDDVAEVDTNRKADLTSISQTGSTASQAISAGTYFYLDGTLARAMTDIANGATFTENTNYETISDGGLNTVSKWKYLSVTKTAIGNSATNVSLSKDLRNCKLFFVEYELAGTVIYSVPTHPIASNTLLSSFGNAVYHCYGYAAIISASYIQCIYTSKGSAVSSYPLYITGIYYME